MVKNDASPRPRPRARARALQQPTAVNHFFFVQKKQIYRKPPVGGSPGGLGGLPGVSWVAVLASQSLSMDGQGVFFPSSGSGSGPVLAGRNLGKSSLGQVGLGEIPAGVDFGRRGKTPLSIRRWTSRDENFGVVEELTSLFAKAANFSKPSVTN